MGDIHIRNLRAFRGGANHEYIERVYLWMLREIFEIARWQQIAIDADAAWTSASNILLELPAGAGAFDVLAANSHQVTSTTGGFTSGHEGLMLSLFATNDDIRGIYNIKRVIDTNTLLVDERTRGGAWATDESGMRGRIHKASDGVPFTGASSYFVVQAPTAHGGNMQLHFTHDGYDNAFVTCYPHGDYGGAALQTGTFTLARAYDSVTRLNAFFADSAAAQWYFYLFDYSSYSSSWMTLSGGELTDVATGDTDPFFMNSGWGWDRLADEASMYMLNELNTATTFFPTFYKFARNYDEDNKRESFALARKLNGGLAKVFRPVVIGNNDTNGGFARGNDPRSYCNQNFADNDEFGSNWWKMGANHHVLVPRDGVNDPQPQASTAA